MKRLYPTLFPGGRSVTRILSTQSKSACSKLVSASGPLCLHSRRAQLSSGPLSSVLPPLQTLLCSAVLQPCSPATVLPRALGGALYIESVTMHCPHVCSELANQGQVRILATGTFNSSTLHPSRILASQSICPQSSAMLPVQESWSIVTKFHNVRQYTNNKNYNKL